MRELHEDPTTGKWKWRDIQPQSEPKVRWSAWLGRGLVWLAKRHMRRIRERLICAEEILRMIDEQDAAQELRAAIRRVEEAQDWMKERPNK